MRKNFLMRFLSVFQAIIIMTVSLCTDIHADNEEDERLLCEVLMEASSGTVIESINGDIPVPVGTAAKLMTVLIAAEKVKSGELPLEKALKTSAYANSMQGAQIWLMPGEEITIDELFRSVIIGNANDAAAVLAEEIGGSSDGFTGLMNDKAKEIGMENTSFTNFNGYYDDDKQISSAKDIAILCAELSEYKFLKEYFTCWHDFVRNGQTELVNSNTLVRSYKGIIGFKAGYTEHSGYFAACGAERDGVTYISVVIGSGDEEYALSEAGRLMNTGFSGYMVFTPGLPDDIPESIPVKGGMAREVPLSYGSVKNVVLPNGAADSISSRVIITDFLYAPVEKGDKAGEIQFLRGEKMMFSVDILAAGPVEKMSALKALVIIIKKLLTF